MFGKEHFPRLNLSKEINDLGEEFDEWDDHDTKLLIDGKIVEKFISGVEVDEGSIIVGLSPYSSILKDIDQHKPQHIKLLHVDEDLTLELDMDIEGYKLLPVALLKTSSATEISIQFYGKLSMHFMD